jgi:hypothetical protein
MKGLSLHPTLSACSFLQVLDPASNTIKSVAGAGVAGFADGAGAAAKLSEPGGLCAGPTGTVFVADTNNSAIR